MKKSIGQRIKQGRKLIGMSQTKLGSQTNIDQRRLSQIELGQRYPTAEEVAILAGQRILKSARDEVARVRRSFKSQWVQRPLPCDREPDRPLGVRIAAAKKTFGSRVGALLHRCGVGEECERRMDFLHHSCLDSGSELFFWLQLAVVGRPSWIAPCRAGFRQMPVLHPESKLVISDVRFPSLELPLKCGSVVLFPQLTVMARANVYRLDGLLGVMVGNNRVWINVEIDGAAHDNQHDEERERHLGLLTLRLSTSELMAEGATEILERKLSVLLGL